jgi:glutamyl-tRNA synthetase
VTVPDLLLGSITAAVDDVVLRRNDGVPAYNLAVVVDDAAQGVDQVVRGDDLATSAPRQRHLADLLGLPPAVYAHVPLVLGPTGRRLAKRDGPVTVADLTAAGTDPTTLGADLARSLGMTVGDHALPSDLLDDFDPARVPTTPWIPPAVTVRRPRAAKSGKTP